MNERDLSLSLYLGESSVQMERFIRLGLNSPPVDEKANEDLIEFFF